MFMYSTWQKGISKIVEAVSYQTNVLSLVHAEAYQRFTRVTDLAHGWEHVSRVYTLAQYIAEKEEADKFIVGVAALLHDLGRTVEEDEQTHHSDSSALLAREIMQKYEIAEQTQQSIIHAILAHSFSRGIEPLTLEAHVVRDADRLDALGAIGIMRWAIVGEQRCTICTHSYEPNDPLALHRQPDDHTYMLDHFFVKLFKLEDTFTTDTARALAKRRTAFMHAYVDEFKRELELS